MARTAAKSGIMPTALVAIEQYYPESQRVVDDPLAYEMLPLAGKIFLSCLRPLWIRNWIIGASEASNPGIWGGLLCRKRYIDDKLIDAQKEIEAVVNLGAGLDTRLYRLKGIEQLPMWEVDQRESVKAKINRLRKAIGSVPSNMKIVAIDFNTADLAAKLTSAEYSISKRTFFIWEGVTQYLTETGVRATFDFLSQAAPGSQLAFTYVRKEFLEGKDLYRWPTGHKQFVASGLWRFALTTESCREFVEHYGWRVVEDIGYAELAAKYITPTGRQLRSTAVERIVCAEKM